MRDGTCRIERQSLLQFHLLPVQLTGQLCSIGEVEMMIDLLLESLHRPHLKHQFIRQPVIETRSNSFKVG